MTNFGSMNIQQVMKTLFRIGFAVFFVLVSQWARGAANENVFTDYRGQKPGTIHRITAADLPRRTPASRWTTGLALSVGRMAHGLRCPRVSR